MSSRYARMLLLMNRLSWSLIQSLKTNAKTPVVNSKKKMIPRNTENYGRKMRKCEQLYIYTVPFVCMQPGAFFYHGTYKLEQKRVFPQRSDAASEAKNEHDPPDHHEKPDWVQTPQVCNG